MISSFALLGDILRPRSFAGLFGAAPSVALASVGLAVAQHGHIYASLEARSMTFGAPGIIALAGAAWLLTSGLLWYARKLRAYPPPRSKRKPEAGENKASQTAGTSSLITHILFSLDRTS